MFNRFWNHGLTQYDTKQKIWGSKGGIQLLRDKLANCKSVVTIVDNDKGVCCARAIITGIAIHEKKPQVNSIKKKNLRMQEYMAVDLHARAGVPVGPCGLDELKKFQSVIEDYRIMVISSAHLNACIFKGPLRPKSIYLYLHGEHYDLITSMKGFLNRSYPGILPQVFKGLSERNGSHSLPK